MQSLRYALVAYVKAPAGEFVENLRREIHPELPHLPAHLSILPPRNLPGSEEEARARIQEVCVNANPFEIALGEVGTFVPVTPTIFLRVAHAGYRMRELHDLLNTDGLRAVEPWPYMPHLTILKLNSVEQAENAFRTAQQRWAQYQGSRRVLIDELTFVREAVADKWEDLAPVPLGGTLALKQSR
jgi:2'-5' RNA ligase